LTEEETAISVNRHHFPHHKVFRFNWN